MAVEGDLRFLSHHDTMRAMERIAARASLPLRYSQGFNPRPVLSLVCPRPVGVATRDDVLVASLEEPMEPADLLARMNEQAPPGMRFLTADPVPAGHARRLREASYELSVPPDRARGIREKVDELAAAASWPVQRLVSQDRGGRRMSPRPIDIRPLVSAMVLGEPGDGPGSAAVLRFTLRPQGDLWARPGEVLRVLGMDEQLDLSRMIRTEVKYG